ncbi:MAG: cupin domain-containing protein [Chitinophagaceae bacterium]|nr:cupin domain-containing protein [Chitinophagaceae bacterium]
MNTKIQDYIVSTTSTKWQPLIEKDVHYKGVFVKSLRFDETQQRSTTILLKFEPGASYPYHNHPGGEELFVLEGEVTIEGAVLKVGDYLYTPVNFKHAVKTENGCTILFMIPKEVEIIK